MIASLCAFSQNKSGKTGSKNRPTTTNHTRRTTGSGTISVSGTQPYCGSVVLTATNPPNNALFQWFQGTNSIAGATGNTYTATATGSYTVQVTNDPSFTYDTVNISVFPKPVASFNFSPDNVCSNIPVNFSNNSTGTGLTYIWNFGDPNAGPRNSSTDINPAHEFVGTTGTGTQTFTVKLVAVSSAGCRDSVSKTITTKQLPSTLLHGTGETVYLDKPYFSKCDITSSLFTFQNASTTSGNVSYKIIWGDNTPDYTGTSFSSTTHNYNIGTYTLQFIVTGPNCTDTGTYYVFRGSNPTGSISSPGSTIGCTGETFSFPFANISNNPPGTQYLIYVNDGSSDTVRFTQENVPTEFTHVFNNGSCNVSPNNTFTVSYLFRNPCGETPGTIGGIRISKKASANFSVSPKDTVCANTVITLTNTGTAGETVPPTGGGACTPGKVVWQISPSTGWTLTSGSLGSDFGSSDVDLWSSGTNTLQLNFTAVGTYTIKFKTGTNRCGLDSITKTICVNPTPTGSFNLDQTTGCTPLTVNTTTTTNIPTCGLNSFKWTVTYTAATGCTPTGGSYNLLNGTSLTSKEPVFQLFDPGVYSIGLNIISPGGACSTVIAPKQVTVKGKPNVALTAPAPICQDQSISPTATATCNITQALTTYLWTFTGGSPGTSDQLTPGSISYNASGSYSIALAVQNECGTTYVTKPLVVNPTPDITTPSNISVCPGTTVASINFAGTVTGAVYSWTRDNANIGVIGTSGNLNTIPGFTTVNNTLNAITSTFTLKASLNGCIKQTTFTITVRRNLPLIVWSTRTTGRR